MPGTGTRKYDSKKALPAPNRKVARTTLAGSARLSIEAIVQRTSIEGAMAAAPRADGKAAKMSLAKRSIPMELLLVIVVVVLLFGGGGYWGRGRGYW